MSMCVNFPKTESPKDPTYRKIRRYQYIPSRISPIMEPFWFATSSTYTFQNKGSYRELMPIDSSSMLFVAATSSNGGSMNLATKFARTWPLIEVRGLCLMSKAPRTVILPYLTVALTITQALPIDGANCRDTICSPSLNCMGSWLSEANTINL